MIGWIWDPKNSYRSQHHLASNFKLSFQFHTIPKISYSFQHYLSSIFKLSFQFHTITKISNRLWHHSAPKFNLSFSFDTVQKLATSYDIIQDEQSIIIWKIGFILDFWIISLVPYLSVLLLYYNPMLVDIYLTQIIKIGSWLPQLFST